MEVNRALMVMKYGLFFGCKNKSIVFKKFHAPNDKEGRSLSELLEYAFLGRSLCTLLRYGWRIISLFTSKSMYVAFVVDGWCS